MTSSALFNVSVPHDVSVADSRDENALSVSIERFRQQKSVAGLRHFGFLLVLLAATSATNLARGQFRAAVHGVVVDEAGAGVGGATVVLRDARLAVVRFSDTTDPSGAFRIEQVSGGLYQLNVRHVSFRSVDSTFAVQSPDPPEVVITLQSRLVPIPEVVVTEDRAVFGRSPVAVSNLGRREIERASDMKDIPVLLSRTPSVTKYSENGNGLGYTYLRMRGFDQKRIAVSINGIPQNDPEAFDVFWINFFDLQGSIQDIQIQRGAGGSLYGSTGIGGAINIVAMPYESVPFAEVNVGFGTYDTRRITLAGGTGLLNDRWTLFGRLSKLDSDGYRDWSWTDYIRYFVGVRRTGTNSVLTLQSFGGRQRDGLAYIGVPKAANRGTVVDDFGTPIDRRTNFSQFTNDVERFNQPHLELHHTLSLNQDAVLDQSLFYIRGNGYFDFDGTFRSAEYLRLPDSLVSGTDRSLPLYDSLPGTAILYRASLEQWQVGWLPRLTFTSEQSRTTAGAEVRLHRSTRWGRIQEAEALPSALTGDSDFRSYSVGGEKAVAVLYGRTERSYATGLTALAEISASASRYRVFDEQFFGTSFSKPYLFLNPRVGLSYSSGSGISAFTSISYASREPRLKALYDGEEAGAGSLPQFETDGEGTIDLDKPFVHPEHVLDLEVGSTISTEHARAGLTAFVMAFHDEIVPSGGLDQFGVPRTGNADRTVHMGIELDGEIRFGRRLDGFGSATLSSHRFNRFTEYIFDGSATVPLDRSGNSIAGFPGIVANVGGSIHFSGATLSTSARYVGAQYVDNAGSIAGDASNRVEPHVLLDANLRYGFSGAMDGLQLSLDVNNVLNSRVLEFGNAGFGAPQFFPAATRNLFFGLRYRFDAR